MEKQLKYYLDTENDILSVYNRETDFFAQYFSQNQDWEMSKISFTEFRHSYNYKLISEEEASKIADGNLPFGLFEYYLSLLS